MKTENYLLDLIKQKKDLALNLSSLGVNVDDTDLLNNIVRKVLDVPIYNSISGSFTPMEDTTVITIDGLPFNPTAFSIQGNDGLAQMTKPEQGTGFIVYGSFDTNAQSRKGHFFVNANVDGTIGQNNAAISASNTSIIGVNIGCGEKSFFFNNWATSKYTTYFKGGVTYYWTASYVAPSYFDITDSGVLSLKAEYRGACPSGLNTQTYAISDNGVGNVGSKNSELPEVLVLPETVNGATVTALANGMFLGNERIKTLVLPKSVTKIPQYFCYNAKMLRNVYNTQEITSVSNYGFGYTRIEDIKFPKLTALGGEAFRDCTYLRSIDVGNITALSRGVFAWCTRLSTIKGGNAVNRLLTGSLFGTRNLQNMPNISLKNVTTFETKAFNHSRFNTDWEDLSKTTGITFDAYSTPYHQHTRNYSQWLKYQKGNVKETILPYTLDFSQVNPEWAEQPFGEILNTEYSADIALPPNRIYKNSCIIWGILGAYCGLKVKNGGLIDNYTFDDPRNLERALWNFNGVNRTLVKQAIESFSPESYIANGDINHIEKLCNALNLSYEIHRGYSSEDIDALYTALQEGKYVYISINTSPLEKPFDFHTHVVLAYGVKKNGEILVADTGDLDAKVGIYDLDKFQTLPQNMTIDSEEDIDPYVKGENGIIDVGRNVTFIVLG